MNHQSRNRSIQRGPSGRRFDQARGLGRRSQLDGRLGRAAGGDKPGPIALHLGVGGHPLPETAQDLGGDRIRRLREAIMDPLAVAPGRDDSRPSKVRQMARNLRLALAERLDEKADADFVVADYVQKPQSRSVAKRLKEAFDVLCCCCHAS